MKRLALLFLLTSAVYAQVPTPVAGLQAWTAPLSPAPTGTSVAKATATANNNALCTAIRPFYWEIGNGTSTLVFGSVGTPTVYATSKLSIASASKMIYATYVVQLRAGTLTANDIAHLHMTSGYHGMPGGGACTGYSSINSCLTQAGFSTQTAGDIGKFFYDGAHDENHASLYTSLGNLSLTALTAAVQTQLGVGTALRYTQPLPAGGDYGSANDVTLVLRGIVSGALAMNGALGTNAVCTLPGSGGCNAVSSPIPEAWHYGIGSWIEDDASTSGDGAFSSPGSFGFYPWIDSTIAYYGVISRSGGSGQGFASAECGRLMRHAWMTGVEETHTTPNQ